MIKSQFRICTHANENTGFFQVEYNIFISRNILYSYEERSYDGKSISGLGTGTKNERDNHKKVGNNYYLYKHSSKRVPGKKNPVPVDTYIGKITPEGIERSNSKKVDVNSSEALVKEYRFSRAIELLCPAAYDYIYCAYCGEEPAFSDI